MCRNCQTFRRFAPNTSRRADVYPFSTAVCCTCKALERPIWLLCLRALAMLEASVRHLARVLGVGCLDPQVLHEGVGLG